MSRAARAGTRLAILVAAILLVGVSVVWANGTLDPNRSRLVSATEALSNFTQFDQVHGFGASVGQVLSGALGDAYDIRGPDVHAMVDVHSGRVVMYRLLGTDAATLATALTAAEATSTATDFLAAHQISTNGLGDPVAELQDHGSSQVIVVIWQRTNAAGVLLPDQRVVEIDPSTGQVTAFLDLRRPFTDPAPPTLTKADAVAVAQASTGLKTIQAARLAVTFGPAGNQLLVWRITLADAVSGSTSTAALEVDAATGSVVNDASTP